MINKMTDFLMDKPHTIGGPLISTEGIEMQMIMNPLLLLHLDIIINVVRAGNQYQAILLKI